MKRFKRLTAILCAASLTLFSGCTVEMPEVTEGMENTASEQTGLPHVRAQDDFYWYVNQETLANAEFEYGESSAASSFNSKMIEDQLKEIINDVVSGSGYAVGTEEYIIKTAYDLFMAYDQENAPVPQILDDLFHEIDGVSSMEELIAIDAKIQKDFGCRGIFNIAITPNYFESGKYIVTFGQYAGMLGVNFEDLEETYRPLDSVQTMGSCLLKAMGHDEETSDDIGRNLAYLVMDVYNDTDMEITKAENQYEYFNVISADEAKKILSNVDLDKYLKAIGMDLKYCNEFGIIDPGQLECLNEIYTMDNLEALKVWEMCIVGTDYRGFIVNGYEDLAQYARVDYASLEEQAMNEVIVEYYAETDPLYVDKHYSDATDQALISMCDDIREGYRTLISDADWLSSSTRRKLLEKLDNIVYVTGSDLERHDPAEYRNVKGKDYFEFYLAYRQKQTSDMTESLGEGMDRKEISMPMQMFNACYDPSLNNITITVAITNAPFFDVKADYFTNLGGLGMVIAHEMGHAFDSNCIMFNQDGVYDPSWISSADVDKLHERNEQAIEYFEKYFTVFGVYHVDGKLTLGENYADLGGMECIVSLTSTDEERKLLFTNYARIWCIKQVSDDLLYALEYDPHSPNVIRVNAILGSINEFYTTFHVAQSDGMYIKPENRISRWH